MGGRWRIKFRTAASVIASPPDADHADFYWDDVAGLPFYVKLVAGTPTAFSLAGVVTFNGRSGVVVPVVGDYSAFFDPLGAAAAAQAASQPLDATLTALAAQDWAANAMPLGTGANAVTQLALPANTFPGRSSTGNVVAKTIGDYAFASLLPLADAAALTALLDVVTTTLKGLQSALDKQKENNLWIDVTANTTALVLAANTGAQNITAINAILAAAPNGSTIYFPPGQYLFNAAWTMPNKMFSFMGRGSNRAGSPATAFTELRWNANVAASLIVLPGSGNGWYTQFYNLTFTTTVDQTAGTVIDAGGNVGINLHECAFQSAGGFFNDVITYGGGAGSNSGNSTTVDACNIQGYKGVGIRVNAQLSSLVIANTVIQGQWGGTGSTPASAMALAGISGGWVGALQIVACDVIGNINNMLLNPVAASSEVCASVQVTNTYFDNAGGSCLKVMGTGATVRCKWTQCTFTTAGTNFTTPGTNLSAIELAGSFVYGIGAQDLQFDHCNVYNTFGTTGTTNGFLVTNCADYAVDGCNVAGWTNGHNITPMASNKTFPSIRGGTVGASGGYAANTVGFLIGAGAYKGLVIQGVNTLNNGTNLTLGAVTVTSNAEAGMYRIIDNPGINPRGSVTTPAVPATTVVVTNITGFRVVVVVRWTATAPTAVTLNGVAQVLPGAAIANVSYQLDPGGTIAWTGTAAPTWSWYAN